jgi:cation-transporting ATPase E
MTEVHASIPFSSARKLSAIQNKYGTWVLGAPEFVLDESKSEYSENFKTVSKYSKLGYRVLVFAHSAELLKHSSNSDDLELPKSLEVAFFILLSEEIRSDAKQTLEYFRNQGVDIKVISGDSPETVLNVAKRVELLGDTRLRAMDAKHLPTEKNELAATLSKYQVFGRVKPEQKLEIVKSLKQSGRVVAMTGDGVNDTLAMKEADLSIAMGNGTQATKAIAKIILVDSHFSKLPNVVSQGRRVMANMERVSSLFLSKTAYSFLLALFIGITGLEYPMLPRHITFISALAIGIPAFFLALPENNQKYTKGFLKRVLMFSIPSGFVVLMGMITIYMYARSANIDFIQTQRMVTILLFCVSIAILALKATPLLSWRLGLVVGMVILGIACYFIRIPRWYFRLELPTYNNLLVTLALSAFFVLLLCIVKRVFSRQRSK